MFWYLVTAAVAFSVGFMAAALLAGGRAHDARRAADLLADAACSLAEEPDEREDRVAAEEYVSLERSQLDHLRRALRIHDELRST